MEKDRRYVRLHLWPGYMLLGDRDLFLYQDIVLFKSIVSSNMKVMIEEGAFNYDINNYPCQYG